jgi:hypothetical protein
MLKKMKVHPSIKRIRTSLNPDDHYINENGACNKIKRMRISENVIVLNKQVFCKGEVLDIGCKLDAACRATRNEKRGGVQTSPY